MTRQQRKTIEREFYRYIENRDKAAAHISERAFDGFGTDFSEPRVQSSPKGNTMEARTIGIISESERIWKWCKVFEKTIERFKWTQKDELMRRRYIERETDTETCAVICVDRSTYYHWLNEILEIAFVWARECGIL